MIYLYVYVSIGVIWTIFGIKQQKKYFPNTNKIGWVLMFLLNTFFWPISILIVSYRHRFFACFFGFHNWEAPMAFSLYYNKLKCRNCDKVELDITPEGQKTIVHYCPICHQREEDCPCPEC